MLTSAKLREPRHFKIHVLKVNMGVYFHAKFEVSRMILTSCRQVDNFDPPPPHLKTNP